MLSELRGLAAAGLDLARAATAVALHEVFGEPFEYESRTQAPPINKFTGPVHYFPMFKPSSPAEEQIGLMFIVDRSQLRDSSMPEATMYSFANEAREAWRKVRAYERGRDECELNAEHFRQE